MADDGFREFLRELTEPLGGVTFRKMFGGLSIYQDGMVFALEIDGSLYFKVDDETRDRFVAEECPQFEYTTKDGRTAQMPYWRAPERLYDEPDEFLDWCRAAVSVATALRGSEVKGVLVEKGAQGSRFPAFSSFAEFSSCPPKISCFAMPRL